MLLLQVIAEYKKAVALIRPGPHTAKVWVSLYKEINKVRQDGSSLRGFRF